MKAVMISIQPYWVFLIIAKAMGWEIEQHKEIEARKNYPKAEDWNKVAKIYCSKDKKSFEKIPEKYRPAMSKFLGKVIGHFVCDRIDEYKYRLTTYEETPYKSKYIAKEELAKTCLSIAEINDYLNGNNAYFWHISNLVIYDEPKELGEFMHCCPTDECRQCKYLEVEYNGYFCECTLTRPPQSWCYVEEKE